jgi:hypothetical protein
MSFMVKPERKQTSLGIDSSTLEKLRKISAKARLTETEIIRDFVNAVYQIMSEGIQESSRISLGSFPELKTSSVRTMLAPILFGLTELPQEIQKDILKAFDYEQTKHGIKDTRKYEKVKEA